MSSRPTSELPGSSRGGIRQLLVTTGVGLLILAAYIWIRASDTFPLPILAIVGGGGGLVLVVGLLMPPPRPLDAQERTNRAAKPGETVSKTGPANHAKGWENRGGTLTLTSGRLVFFSHGGNVNNADVVILLTDIASVQPANTLGFIPNAFRVILHDGSRHQFTVFSRKTWIEAIERG
ncbi:MAG: hypothetical protein U0744_21300 [Gemmataceae bacterium]